jgi:hypothetical protein
VKIVRIATLLTVGVSLVLPAQAGARAWTVVSAPRDDATLDAATAVPGSATVWATGYSPAPFFEREQNGQWARIAPALGTAADAYLGGLAAVSGNDVWAVGRTPAPPPNSPFATLAEHWDGSRWSIVPTPTPAPGGFLGGVTTSPSGMWAVGGAGNQPLIEHLTGGRWTVVPSPTAGAYGELDAVTAVPGTRRLWAVGFRAAADGEQYALAERYDGRSWTTVPIPSYANPGDSISGLSAVIALSTADVWAIGAGLTTTAEQPLVEHWNGRRWTIVPGQPVNAIPTDATLVPGTHTVWIAGSISVGAEENETFTERLDNGHWHVVPSANPDQGCEHSDEFLGVAATARAVWAVGDHFELLNGCGDAVSGSLIERY